MVCSSDNSEKINPNLEQCRAFLRLLCEAGQVYELRCPKAGKYKVVSGYFDDVDRMAAAALDWSGKAEAVYLTLNPVNPALLARASNTTALGAAANVSLVLYTTSGACYPEVAMTPEQIEQLGPAFAAYLQQFLFCCGYTQTFDLLGLYCRGLLSDLKRKTCEPIALYAGIAVRTLQEFLKDHVWSFHQVRTLHQRHVAAGLLDNPRMTSAPSASSMRQPPRRRAPRPPASNASTAARSASWRTASLPFTSALSAAATRP